MATRTFLSLESKLAPSVPGCPEPTLEQYVRDAAIDACERTLAWRYEQDAIRLTPGVYEYGYDTPSYTEVCGIIHAAVNGNAVSPLVQEDIHRIYPDWPSADAGRRSEPRHIGQFDPDNFVVVPIPDDSVAYDMKMFLALRPTPDATGMNKTVLDELESLIIHHTLQHLLLLPNKSWYNDQLAIYHAKQYTYKLSARRAKANLGVGRAAFSVRMTPLA